jgi:hypothetical protein
MNNQENQKRLVNALRETQSFKNDDPFRTYYKRQEAFESFLYSSDGLPNCGCGNPDDTLLAFMEALDYCALRDSDERKAFLLEKFGVEYVTDDRLVQLLFYVLDDKGYIEHNFSINGCFLSDAGKALRAILTMHLNEPSVEQISNNMFGIDFDAVLADGELASE